MGNWSSACNTEVMDWLLEEENSSVRFYTLTDILGRPENDAEAAQTRRNIMRVGMAAAILEKQREACYRETFPRFYHAKYQGLVWQLIVLAELGATLNEQIEEQCEYLLAHSQEIADGGFAMHAAIKTGGGRASEVVPCLSGNMAYCLLRFGYLSDSRLQKGIDWITRNMHLRDGARPDVPIGPDACWGSHTCFMGAIKPLKALCAIPEKCRKDEVREAIARITDYFLIHHIYKRSRDLSKVSKPGWLKFGFPLMYQTDALEILDMLTGLGIRDERMNDAIALVYAKQDQSGRWRAESTANNEKLLLPFSPDDQSKWVTLRALRVLKRWEAGGIPT